MRVQEGICVYVIFSLSGPCELLFLLCFTAYWRILRSGECNVVSLYVLCCPVNVSVCFVCCVFDNVCELFVETIRNVFSVCGGALLDRPCMVFQRVCVLCL